MRATCLSAMLGLAVAACGTSPTQVVATSSEDSQAATQAPVLADILQHTATLSPTVTPTPSTTREPTPTITPSPSLIPTLGTPVTRTSAPPAQCPEPRDQPAAIDSFSPWEDDYEAQIVGYLNARGSADGLQQELARITVVDGETTWRTKAQVFNVDVTGDTTPDVVVDLIFYSSTEFEPVFAELYISPCREGLYTGRYKNIIASAKFSGTSPVAGIGVREIRDMNLDGVPEIVFSHLNISHGEVTVFSSSDYVRFFQIIEWDGEEFTDLIRNDLPSFASAANGDGVIRDANGDGTFELVLSNGAVRQPGRAAILYRPHTKTWSWHGTVFTVSCVEASFSPLYRYQAVEDGDDAMLCGEYDRALTSYQRAIFDGELLGWKPIVFYDPPILVETAPEPDPDERPRLSAYSRYRLILLHVAQGFTAEAETVYQSLQDQFPSGAIGNPYAALATAFWEEFQVEMDIYGACAKAVEYATKNKDEVLTPLSSDYYYYSTRHSDAEDICPFN